MDFLLHPVAEGAIDHLVLPHNVFSLEFSTDDNRAEMISVVALNVHHSAYPSFENRVLLHLAAGHLVLSEPLSPLHGLRPGVDLLEVRTPQELRRVIRAVREAPEGFDAIRRHGRRSAERFRASRVWPRLIADLVRDVRVFGGRARS